MTWDEKLGLAIRRFFAGLTGQMPGFDEWEQERLESLDRQVEEDRQRRAERRRRAIEGEFKDEA